MDDEPSYKRKHLIPLDQAYKRNLEVTYDAAGYIATARQPNPFLIDVLLERKIINHDHHFYGVQMISFRKVFLDPVRTKVGMLRIGREEGEAYDKPIPIEDTDYLKVLREIRNQRWKEIIMAVCTEEADMHLCGQLERREGTVAMAFGNLAETIMALWELKAARIKNP